MHLPLVRDEKTGEVIEPRNLTLHNGESSLLFLDGKNKNSNTHKCLWVMHVFCPK